MTIMLMLLFVIANTTANLNGAATASPLIVGSPRPDAESLFSLSPVGAFASPVSGILAGRLRAISEIATPPSDSSPASIFGSPASIFGGDDIKRFRCMHEDDVRKSMCEADAGKCFSPASCMSATMFKNYMQLAIEYDSLRIFNFLIDNNRRALLEVVLEKMRANNDEALCRYKATLTHVAIRNGAQKIVQHLVEIHGTAQTDTKGSFNLESFINTTLEVKNPIILASLLDKEINSLSNVDAAEDTLNYFNELRRSTADETLLHVLNTAIANATTAQKRLIAAAIRKQTDRRLH